MSATPRLVSVSRIWRAAPHNAFTDLIRWQGRWLCAFREGRSHAGSSGRVRVLESTDGTEWQSAALVSERGVDLRDPKLSLGGGGRLELLMGGSPVRSGAYLGRRPRIAFSSDGRSWSPPEPILAEGDWLWRSEVARGRHYGISYRLPSKRRWTVHLMAGAHGGAYREICELRVPGKPNEATIRFRDDGSALALVRRESGAARAWIGSSLPPYLTWSWVESAWRVGGPNFIFVPGGEAWAAARILRRGRPLVALCRMTERSLEPVLDLPSGGDCGYPGMVYHRGKLWLSYYSSHEKKTSIYLARVDIDCR